MSEERFKGMSTVKLIALTSAALLVGQSREEIAEALENFCRKCFQEGLEEGHASRDPEVEKLKDAIREMVYDPRTAEENRKLKEEYKWAMAGAEAEAHHADELQAELSAEREASRKLVKALHHCRNRPHEHNPPPDFIITRCEVIDDALKLYTPPGHSPEGETLFKKSDKENRS